MKKKRIGLFIVAFSFLIALVSFSFDGRNVRAATSGEYTLKVGGENTDSLNIDNGNYNITGNPGETVDLKLLVINQASSTRQFRFDVNTAYTTDSGSLAYNDNKVTDPSLKIQTRNLATPKSSIFKVPGNKTATLTFKIKVPEQKYDGSLMGGVTITPYKEKAKGTVSENGTLIKNKFSYSIPIQISQKGSETPEAKYSVGTIKPGLVTDADGQTQGVKVNVHNSTNSYTGSLTANVVITKKGDKEFKIKKTLNSQNIAPTTNFNMGVSWGKQKLQSGDYHLKLTYKTQGGIKSWVINKDFTITNNDAAKYNKLAGIKPNYLWLYILLGILALAIILGLGIYLGKKNNNKGNNSGNTTRRRRR